MFYEPPEKWTEKLIDELPFGEDDRYERKSGDEISAGKLEDFSKKIAKEIGAFANSFGGTLFLGIADDKTKTAVEKTNETTRSGSRIWTKGRINESRIFHASSH